VNVLVSVFWVVMPCERVGRYKRFGGTYCLDFQGWRWRPYILPKVSIHILVHPATYFYCFVRVWNLISRPQGWTWTGGVWEQGVEENIWTCVFFVTYHHCGKIKEGKIGGIRSTHGRWEMHRKFKSRKTLTEETRARQEHNVACVSVEWIHLALDKVRWWDTVNTRMNHGGP
jgi:hypothetical protein